MEQVGQDRQKDNPGQGKPEATRRAYFGKQQFNAVSKVYKRCMAVQQQKEWSYAHAVLFFFGVDLALKVLNRGASSASSSELKRLYPSELLVRCRSAIIRSSPLSL